MGTWWELQDPKRSKPRSTNYKQKKIKPKLNMPTKHDFTFCIVYYFLCKNGHLSNCGRKLCCCKVCNPSQIKHLCLHGQRILDFLDFIFASFRLCISKDNGSNLQGFHLLGSFYIANFLFVMNQIAFFHLFCAISYNCKEGVSKFVGFEFVNHLLDLVRTLSIVI